MQLFDVWPLNSIAWTVGSLAILAYAYRTNQAYQKTNNQLARSLRWLGLLSGIGLAWLGVPPLLTQDEATLRVCFVICNIFIDLGMLIQVRVLWLITLKDRVPIWALWTPMAALSAAAIVELAQTTKVFTDGAIMQFITSPLGGYLRGTFFLLIFLPSGILFLHQATTAKGLVAKLKAIMLGVTYLLTGILAVANYYLFQNRETPAAASVTLAVFIAFLAAMLWPSRKN